MAPPFAAPSFLTMSPASPFHFSTFPPSHPLPPTPHPAPAVTWPLMSRWCPSADLIPSVTVALAPVKWLRRGDFVNCSFIEGKSENLTRSKAVRRLNPWNTKEPCCTLTGFSIFPFVGQPCECDWSLWGVPAWFYSFPTLKGFFNWQLWIFLDAVTGGEHFQHVSLQLQ